MKKTPTDSGTSLLDLVVYVFIFALVTTSIYTILIGSLRNYRLAQAGAEVQESAQSAAYRLSKELEESASNSLVISSSGIVGVSFESARNSNGQMQYEYPGNPIAGCDSSAGGIAGMPCWHQYICYYLDTDPSAPGELALYRKVKAHADSWAPGTPGAPSSFQSDATLPMTLVARHLSNAGFSLTRNGSMYLLSITTLHFYGNANSFGTQLNINIRQ